MLTTEATPQHRGCFRPLLLLALTTPAMCGGYAAEQVSPDGALPIQLLKTLGALLAAFGATRVAQAAASAQRCVHRVAVGRWSWQRRSR